MSISEEQAEDSEYEGDSDADDEKLNTTNNSPKLSRSKSLPCTSTSPPSTSATSMDWDSDDSIKDPDYQIDDTPSKRKPFFYTDDSSSDDEDYAKKNTSTIKDFTDFQSSTYEWNNSAKDPEIYKNFSFSDNSKPNFCVNFESPKEIFSHFFGECKHHILVESERYATQNNVNNFNLTGKEFDAFLGILIITGFHPLPSLRMYWSTDQNLHVGRIAKIMSLRRFLQILRYLHANDNTQMPKRGQEGFDKLYKIRPLLNILSNKYKTSFSISRHVSIDESMVGFKGRTSLKQYMPLKPTKRGFKIWALTCAETGYLYNFIVYEGKSDSVQEGTLGEKTVLALSESLRNTGRCLFFDNFFSTIPLLSNLLSLGFFACGTFRINRKFYPKDKLVSDKELKMGDSDFVQSNDISIVKWRDRGSKPVVIISNFHNPSKMSHVTRTNKKGEQEIIQCPQVVKDYNKFMGGVDHFDQLLECYNVSKKSRRWWVKLFYYLFDTAIVNSYIMHCQERKRSNKKIIPQLQFRSILANELISDFQGKNKRGPQKITRQQKISKVGSERPISVSSTLRQANLGSHLPSKGTYRRCAYCSTKKNVKRSNILCEECGVALCIECYKPFHEK